MQENLEHIYVHQPRRVETGVSDRHPLPNQNMKTASRKKTILIPKKIIFFIYKRDIKQLFSGDATFVGFLGDLKTPKGNFEINWPLVISLDHKFPIKRKCTLYLLLTE